MARFLPVQPDTATASVREIYAIIEGYSNQTVPHLFKSMASSATFLKAFEAIYRTVFVDGCSVNDKIRILAVLKASKVSKCTYYTTLATESAKKLGITEEQLKAIDDHEKSDLFTYDEKLVLSYSEMITRDPSLVSDDFFKFLKNHYTQQQVTELTVISAFTNMINRFSKALEIDSDKK